ASCRSKISVLASWTAQLWQCRAHMPRRPEGSISLDCRAQAAERLTETVVFDVGQAFGDPRRHGLLDLARRRQLSAPERRLTDGNAADSLPAEKTVHTFQNDGREMLYLKRRRTFYPQNQSSGFRSLEVGCTRPVDFKRLAVGCDLRAHDVAPMRKYLGRGKTLCLKHIAEGCPQQVGKRPGKTARGLAHEDGPCAIVSAMTVAARTPSRKKADPPAPADLLAWYDRHARVLPWRTRPGHRADPYRVWLPEIMLQQTTVKAAAPYFARFLWQWPTIAALAKADLEDVLRAWAGLGYYARARNLHACAKAVVARYKGAFPVDGNVERVVTRLFAVEDVLPAAKPAIRQLATSLLPARRFGDFAQALMDLGATICSPKRPACALCPWSGACIANARGEPDSYPRKAPKREGKLRRGAAFVALREDEMVLLRRRPEKGLLGGMSEVPGSEWTHQFDVDDAVRLAPDLARAKWRRVPGVVRHVFTHFPLELAVFLARVPRATKAPKNSRWVKLTEVSGEALPNVMRKVLAHALDAR